MKKLRLPWSAVAIIAPVAVVCAILVGSIHGTDRVLAAKKTANIQVVLIANVTGPNNGPAGNYQNLFLNAVSVRINPKPKNGGTTVPNEGDQKWVTIPVPAGVGITSHGNTGDLQIDMLAGQSKAQFFNTAAVLQNTYHSIELELDTTNPGFIVPPCPGGGATEGCINFPIAFVNPGAQLAVVDTTGFTPAKGTLTVLPILLNVQIVSAPAAPGQPYMLDVTIEPASTTEYNLYLGSVTGTVTNAGGAVNKKKVSKLTVTAEVPETNTVAASARVQSSGKYLLYLPAAADLGTLYDLYVSGGTASYEAVRLQPSSAVSPGVSTTVDFGSVATGKTLGSLTGKISDACTTLPIAGATLQLLIPPDGTSGVDCALTPTQCVSVATALTDNVGSYPVPGTIFAPAPFTQIPTDNTYTLEVSASGYDPMYIDGVKATSGASGGKSGGSCTGSTSKVGCNLSLTTGYIKGTVMLGAAPQPGENTFFQVFAEHTGTSNLVGALAMPQLIRSTSSNASASFSINVPTSEGPYDLFAQAIDLYQGASDPYPGHTIVTASGVAAPASCATATPAIFSDQMDCAGHGSITGSVVNPDSATTVELLKNNVALTSVAGGVPSPAPSPDNTYLFCAPPDTYNVQRVEQGTPVGTPTAVGTMATPIATSTPCPSTCFTGANSCPGICGTTFGPTL